MTRSIKIAICVAMAMLSLVTTSCRNDIGEHDTPVMFGDEIIFDISFDKDWTEGQTSQSRTEVGERIAALKVGSDSLFISVSVEPNRSLPLGLATRIEPNETPDSLANATDTRGEALTTATLSEFFVTAALSGSKLYFEDLPMTPTSSSGKFWPADRLTFMSYAPEAARPSSFTAPDGNWQAQFTYTMPAPTGSGEDAVAQPDYVYCLKPNALKESAAVDLEFHHAFAAIAFKVGDMPDNTTVKSISLKQIYSTGVCTLTESAGNTLFAWASHSSPQNYKQTFNKSVADGDTITAPAQTFMVVPQTVPSTAELSIVFAVNSSEYTLTRSLNDLGITNWQADKRYQYTLSINNEVQIEITDRVSNNYKVKDNVVITNRGLNTAYVRVAIVGWWEKEISGEWQSIMPWNDNNLATTLYGEFDWGTSWSTYWVKHSDGFYYYKQPLAKGATTAVPIFNSYTLTEAAPALNAELRLQIIVQGLIQNAEGKEQWAYLDTLFP